MKNLIAVLAVLSEDEFANGSGSVGTKLNEVIEECVALANHYGNALIPLEDIENISGTIFSAYADEWISAHEEGKKSVVEVLRKMPPRRAK